MAVGQNQGYHSGVRVRDFDPWPNLVASGQWHSQGSWAQQFRVSLASATAENRKFWRRAPQATQGTRKFAVECLGNVPFSRDIEGSRDSNGVHPHLSGPSLIDHESRGNWFHCVSTGSEKGEAYFFLTPGQILDSRTEDRSRFCDLLVFSVWFTSQTVSLIFPSPMGK